ncbi:MAG TPA: HAD-IA family hydrolase [Chloroflexia bacterium]|nr:HAD-IA family hydrolase [Chloroflexia bacterium]
MKKLIVFDLDGTLIDSSVDVGTAIVHAARSVCGLSEEAVTVEHTMPLFGKNLHTTFSALLPVEHHARVDECIEAYRSYYMENCARYTRPYAGIVELLKELRENNKILAVATTKLQPTVERVAEMVGLTPYFDLLQGVDGFPSKPDPTILKVIMHKLDITAGEMLMVGDTDNDILCARNAGVQVCAVSWGGAWSARQLAALQPDYLVDTVKELGDLLGSF